MLQARVAGRRPVHSAMVLAWQRMYCPLASGATDRMRTSSTRRVAISSRPVEQPALPTRSLMMSAPRRERRGMLGGGSVLGGVGRRAEGGRGSRL